MDSLITAAGRALAAGDALGALKHVALRDDPPALALRGIAMAQLGELARSRDLLRRAARGFGEHEELARARCVVAAAEVALAMRELVRSPRALLAAADVLDARDDAANALHARLIALRGRLLVGRLDDAAALLRRIEIDGANAARARRLPPALAVVASLCAVEVALRSLRTADAVAALARARAAADRARVPALHAEVAEAAAALERVAARRLHRDGHAEALRLAEVESLLASGAFVVNACRRGLQHGGARRVLASRPILFELARALAEAWPGDVDRQALIGRAFGFREIDETHRARLRVEIGRLRALVAPLARIEASARGYALVLPERPSTADGDDVVVLLPPIDGEQASLLALLADGAAWSTSALSLALDASQRTVQRALVELEAEGRVRSIGRARAQRWLAPPLATAFPAGFTTNLLLPGALSLA